MQSRNSFVVDGIGRILGLGALVLAIGGGLYLYQQNQQLSAELTKLSAASSGSEAFETFAADWDQKLTSALVEFNKRANESKEEFDAAREARNRIFNEAEAQRTDGLSETQVKGLIADQIALLQIPSPAAELKVARTVMKPIGDAKPPLPAVRNVGNEDAEIVAARFKPTKGSEFVNKADSRTSSDERVVIEYAPDHNQDATIKGAHRFYERTYPLPLVVVRKDTMMEVSIEIRANNRHLGLGDAG